MNHDRTERLYPDNDSIFPKQIGNGMVRHILLGGLLSLSFISGIVALILALTGVAGWFWFGLFATATVVFFIATFVNFAATARSMWRGDW